MYVCVGEEEEDKGKRGLIVLQSQTTAKNTIEQLTKPKCLKHRRSRPPLWFCLNSRVHMPPYMASILHVWGGDLWDSVKSHPGSSIFQHRSVLYVCGLSQYIEPILQHLWSLPAGHKRLHHIRNSFFIKIEAFIKIPILCTQAQLVKLYEMTL